MPQSFESLHPSELEETRAPVIESLQNDSSWNDTSAGFGSSVLLELAIPFTIVYGVIFLTGVIGNISTCIVISKNKSMHTATNYYLFSLAVSDMLLLLSGLPLEMYKIWSPDTFIFGHFICFLQGFSAEMSANATVRIAQLVRSQRSTILEKSEAISSRRDTLCDKFILT